MRSVGVENTLTALAHAPSHRVPLPPAREGTRVTPGVRVGSPLRPT